MEKDSAQFKRFIHEYWNYYRELEDDFLMTKKYVSFDVANYSTYSMEYLKLYQAVCSEIDVLGKAMAFRVNSDFKPDDKQNNILKWWYEIQDVDLLKEESSTIFEGKKPKKTLSTSICIFLDDVELRPWESFKTERYQDAQGDNRVRVVDNSIPDWWSFYNKIKHNRINPVARPSDGTNYAKANLGNLIKAFAALYLLEKSYMEVIGTENDLEAFFDQSRLFVRRSFMTSNDIDTLCKLEESDLRDCK